jgi:hypothetical protein
MGSTPADTEREITQLRGDMTAALDEVERRLRGGLRGVAGAEARISTDRARRDAANNPTLLGVVGVVAVAAVGYGVYSLLKGRREASKPQNRLKRGVKQAREELEGRVAGGVEATRGKLERAKQRSLLVKLDPEDGGFMRVVEARIESPTDKNKGRQDVIKKLVWAGLLSVFMAVGSVLARRVAGSVWKATVHEDPPTEKSK